MGECENILLYFLSERMGIMCDYGYRPEDGPIDDDDYYIYYVDPDYGYVEDEEDDAYENNYVYDED